jgi:hypothetical protein
MPDTALLTILTNAGIAGVFVVLFLLGLIYPKTVVDDLRAERDSLRQAVMSERERADAAVAAAQATRDVFTALRAGMEMGGSSGHPADQAGQVTGKRAQP